MIEVKFTFETEEEMQAWLQKEQRNTRAAQALANLRDELRQVNKYGTPTERDEYWYYKLFEYCEQEEVDAWEL